MNIRKIEELNVKIYADGADRDGMIEMYHHPWVQGLTTNPTLMRKAGIRDYKAFAQDIMTVVKDKPISFEVFSDDFLEMERQAMEIASWGNNVFIKIPVTNTKKIPSYDLIKKLSSQKLKLNITAVMTLGQIQAVIGSLQPDIPSYISVFAGRIADTGRDPLPLMAAAVELLSLLPAAELIWASPRELLNIMQADTVGCHIITITNDIIKKLSLVGYDLERYSLDTVNMFYHDAMSAEYTL